jgi:SAM-dependent methyltransferase
MIAYEVLSPKWPGWGETEVFLGPLIDRYHCENILEIGAGANPALDKTYVREAGLRYVISDVNAGELAKAEPKYGAEFDPLVLDVEHAEFAQQLAGQFDCIFSKLTGEHIGNAQVFHQNVHTMLRPGGLAVHFFATLWALPFTVNHLLPNSLSGPLQQAIAPRDLHWESKFPARYSWSRGPTKTMVRRLESIGFKVEDYIGYFGHYYYQKKLPMLHKLEMMKSKMLVKNPVPLLCSYATVVLRKQ